MHIRLSITSVILFSIIIFSGCSKKSLEEDSSGVLTADLLLTNKAGFENALFGLYDEVRRYRSGDTYGSINDAMNMQAVIGVDNAYGNYRDAVVDVFNLWKNLNQPSYAHYSRVFAWLYETINAANTIITRSDNEGIDWTTDDKNLIVAEARCIRAWCYRHLTYLWGDVPLTLVESSGDNIKTDWERTPVADVRKAMEDDLLFAEQYLPDVASSDSRLIKGVAQHYLAELYLATKQYDKAKAEALKVINNPSYKLIIERYGVNKSNAGTPFTDMFIDGNSKRSQGNTEALWTIQNEYQVIGGEGNTLMRRYWVNRYYSFSISGASPFKVVQEFGGRGLGRFSPTKFTFSLYHADDDRGGNFAFRFYYQINNTVPKATNPRTGQPYKTGDTIFLDYSKNETLNNPGWPSTRKWDYALPGDLAIDDREYNDQVLLRVAETYLVLAEADYYLSDLQGAADAINTLRRRAHTSDIAPADVTLDFILDERSRELFSEEDRRYALTRTGKWLERTKLYNKIASPNIIPRDTLLPIPQKIIDANLTKSFPQNPGY